jgi:hypothetical protein
MLKQRFYNRVYRFRQSFKFTIVVFTTLLVFLGSCKAQQTFKYKLIANGYLPSVQELAPYKLAANSLTKTAYDATQALPPGYVKDGSVDYTTYVQRVINGNANVLMPNFPILINSSGISVLSNRIILFGPNSKLIMAPNNLTNYQILRIFNANNVRIYFPVLVGDRDQHTGTTGEWGMGISIASSSNIQIINPKVSKCWGDGIYIGQLTKNSSDIQIYYPQVDYARRNGISIVSATNVTILNPVVSNINGTEPMAGIDMEPNQNSDSLDNITIDRPVTFNSKRGLMIVLMGLIGKNGQQVNINVKNHIDDQSQTALHYSGYKQFYNYAPIGGNINITNSTWKNNKLGFGHGFYNKYGPVLQINKVKTVNDLSGKSISQTQVLDAIKNTIVEKDKIQLIN